jgi:hypothetical protein
MGVLKSKPWVWSRRLAYLLLALICLDWWLDNISGGYFNWFISVVFLMAVLGFIACKKIIDRFIGFCMLTGSLYMLAAVISAYARYKEQGHHAWAVSALAFGGVLFLLCLLFGHLLIFSSVFSSDSDGLAAPGIKDAG